MALIELLDRVMIPENWTKAIVVPLHKKGSKLRAEHYRPISLTCSLCKIMEKLIVSQLTPFLLNNETIPPHQHGFLPKRSTTSNLLCSINDWTMQIEQHHPIDVIYLDFERAFDKVPFERLLYKLDHFDVRGSLLGWIGCFLKHRSFQVRANGYLSQSRAVVSGVAPGVCIGPTAIYYLHQ